MDDGKIIRLNKLQISALKVYLSDVEYYIVHDHYKIIDPERNMTNKMISNILHSILEKLQ